MTTFDNREKSFENKFAHEEELSFKARSRRNKLLGAWAAGKLGKAGHDAEEYARNLVSLGVGLAADQADKAIIAHLIQDFTAAGIAIAEKEIRAQMEELLQQARQQILGDAS